MTNKKIAQPKRRTKRSAGKPLPEGLVERAAERAGVPRGIRTDMLVEDVEDHAKDLREAVEWLVDVVVSVDAVGDTARFAHEALKRVRAVQVCLEGEAVQTRCRAGAAS